MANRFEKYVGQPTENRFSKFIEEPKPVEKPAEPSSGIRRFVGDPLVSAVKGAVGFDEAAVGLADLATGGHAGKFVKDVGLDFAGAQKGLDEMYSPEQKAANRKVQEAEGFIPTVGAMVANPSTIPHTIIQSVPQMIGGQGIAKGAMKLAPKLGTLAAGAIGEGAITAGSNAEQTRQQTNDGLLTPKQAAIQAGSGALTGLITGAMGAAANKLGVGDVNTALLGGSAGRAVTNKGIARRTLEGGVTEGIQETAQSAQEQAASNLALDKPIGEGVGNAAAIGLATGIGMGAPTAAITPNEKPAPAADESAPQVANDLPPEPETTELPEETEEIANGTIPSNTGNVDGAEVIPTGSERELGQVDASNPQQATGTVVQSVEDVTAKLKADNAGLKPGMFKRATDKVIDAGIAAPQIEALNPPAIEEGVDPETGEIVGQREEDVPEDPLAVAEEKKNSLAKELKEYDKILSGKQQPGQRPRWVKQREAKELEYLEATEEYEALRKELNGTNESTEDKQIESEEKQVPTAEISKELVVEPQEGAASNEIGSVLPESTEKKPGGVLGDDAIQDDKTNAAAQPAAPRKDSPPTDINAVSKDQEADGNVQVAGSDEAVDRTDPVQIRKRLDAAIQRMRKRAETSETAKKGRDNLITIAKNMDAGDSYGDAFYKVHGETPSDSLASLMADIGRGIAGSHLTEKNGSLAGINPKKYEQVTDTGRRIQEIIAVAKNAREPTAPAPTGILKGAPEAGKKVKKKTVVPTPDPWTQTAEEHNASKLASNPYRESYEKSPEAAETFKADNLTDWVKGLEERATQGRIPENVLDSYVEKFGTKALYSVFRGVKEKGIEGYLQPEIRAEQEAEAKASKAKQAEIDKANKGILKNLKKADVETRKKVKENAKTAKERRENAEPQTATGEVDRGSTVEVSAEDKLKASYKSKSDEAKAEFKQMLEDMIATKKELKQPYQNLTDSLAIVKALDKGEEPESGAIYANPVAGHPENFTDALTAGLVPIRVRGSAQAAKKLDAAQDLYSMASGKLAKAEYALKNAKTAKDKKAATAELQRLSNKENIRTDSVNTLRDETLPELQRMYKEAVKRFGEPNEQNPKPQTATSKLDTATPETSGKERGADSVVEVSGEEAVDESQKNMGAVIRHVFDSIVGGKHAVRAYLDPNTKYLTSEEFDKKVAAANKKLKLKTPVTASDIIRDGIMNDAYTGGVGHVKAMSIGRDYPEIERGKIRNIRIRVTTAEQAQPASTPIEEPIAKEPENSNTQVAVGKTASGEMDKNGTFLSPTLDLFEKAVVMDINRKYFKDNIRYALTNTNKARITDGEHFYENGKKFQVRPDGTMAEYGTDFSRFEWKLRTGIADGFISYNEKAKKRYDELIAEQEKADAKEKAAKVKAEQDAEALRQEAVADREAIEQQLANTKFVNGQAAIPRIGMDPVTVKGKTYKGLIVTKNVGSTAKKGIPWMVYTQLGGKTVVPMRREGQGFSTLKEAQVYAMRLGNAIPDLGYLPEGPREDEKQDYEKKLVVAMKEVRPDIGYAAYDYYRAVQAGNDAYVNVYEALDKEKPEPPTPPNPPKGGKKPDVQESLQDIYGNPATFTSEREATEHLVKAFGPGINTLIRDGILNITRGQDAWPPQARRSSQGRQSRIEGVYVNDKVFIDIDATVKHRLQAVALHEIGEHFNLRKMLGTADYEALQNQIANRAKIKGSEAERIWNKVEEIYTNKSLIRKAMVSGSKEQQAWIVTKMNHPELEPKSPEFLDAVAKELGQKFLEVGDEAFIAEVIAKLGEVNPNAPWYRRLIARIKAFLMERGLARGFVMNTLTDQDIHALLVASLQSAARSQERGVPRFYGAEGAMQSVPAWHGSPHDHNKFDSSKIGTGEGAQAFGYGHYFTGKKSIAEWYRNKLASEFSLPSGTVIDSKYLKDAGFDLKRRKDILNALQETSGKTQRAGAIVGLNNSAQYPTLEWVKNNDASKFLMGLPDLVSSGKLYDVELAPEQDELLDWDKPLSEQSEKVRTVIEGYVDDFLKEELKSRYKVEDTQYGFDVYDKKYGRYLADNGNYDDAKSFESWAKNRILKDANMDSGSGIYDYFAKQFTNNDAMWESLGKAPFDVKNVQQAASEYLHSLGIRGIRYKAEAGKSDANNYVIFNDDDVSITAKYSLQDADTITVDGKERSTTNSNGKPIAQTEEGLRNFWRWFSDSQAVSKNGRANSDELERNVTNGKIVQFPGPVILYHGTKGDINTFDKEKIGTSDFGSRGRGFYLSANSDTANVYAALSPTDGAANVLPVYVKADNPFIYDLAMPLQDAAQSEKFTSNLIGAGYDAVFEYDADGNLNEVVVFSPNQIKSAIGNTGDFSPDSNDIRYSIVDDFLSPNQKEKAEGVKDTLVDWKDTLGEKLKKQSNAIFTVLQMEEQNADILPGIADYTEPMHRRRTVIDTVLRDTDRIISTWKKLDKKGKELLADVMHTSTLHDVDASRAWSGVQVANDTSSPVLGNHVAYTQAKLAERYKQKLLKQAEAIQGRPLMKGAKATEMRFQAPEQANQYVALLNQAERDQTAFRANRYKDENLGRRIGHAQVSQAYRAMPDAGKEVYMATHNMHNKMADTKLQILTDRVSEAIYNGEKRQALNAMIRKQFEANKLDFYYAPLLRFGDQWFYGTTKDGKPYFETFNNEEARDRAAKKFNEENNTKVETGTTLRDLAVKAAAVGDTFITDVIKIVDSKDIDEKQSKELQDEIYQMYLSMLPEVSLRHGSQHRKGTLGFEQDAMHTFAYTMHHGASQIANMKEGREMEQALDELREVHKLSQNATGRQQAGLEIAAAKYLSENFDELSQEGAIDDMLADEDNDEDEHILKTAKILLKKFGTQEESDTLDALDDYVAKLKLRLARAALITDADKSRAANVIGEIGQSYNAMVNTQSSDMDAAAAYLRQFGFIYMLGFGFSSGLFNTMQTPMVSMPVVSAKYGLPETVKQFKNAYAEFATAVKSARHKDANGNYDMRDEDGNASITVMLEKKIKGLRVGTPEWDTVNEELNFMSDRKADGTISRTQTHDAISVGKEGVEHGGPLFELTKKAGLLFHHGERLNREVTLLAAFRTARKANKAEKPAADGFEEAANYARKVTNDTHLEYSPENAARIFRGWPAGIAMQFKKYQQGMYYLWGKNVKNAFRKWEDMSADTPAEIAAKEKAKQDSIESKRALAGLLAMQASVAGVFGLPLADTLVTALEVALGLVDPDDDDDKPYELEQMAREWLTENFGEAFATAVTKGVVNAFTPVDTASRMDLSTVFFRKPLEDLEGKDQMSNWLNALFGPTGGMVQRLWEGKNLISDGQYGRGLEQILPKFLSDPIQAARFLTEDARSLDGIKLKDMSLPEIALKAVGIGSSSLKDKYTERSYDMGDMKALQEARSKLLKKAARAKMEGTEIPIEDIEDWNRKHPGKPVKAMNIRASIRATNAQVKRNGARGFYVDPNWEVEEDED